MQRERGEGAVEGDGHRGVVQVYGGLTNPRGSSTGTLSPSSRSVNEPSTRVLHGHPLTVSLCLFSFRVLVRSMGHPLPSGKDGPLRPLSHLVPSSQRGGVRSLDPDIG